MEIIFLGSLEEVTQGSGSGLRLPRWRVLLRARPGIKADLLGNAGSLVLLTSPPESAFFLTPVLYSKKIMGSIGGLYGRTSGWKGDCSSFPSTG